MNNAIETTERVPNRRSLLPIVSIYVVFVLAATIHSHFQSLSVTLFDVTVSTEEGSVSLNIPLVPIAHDAEPKIEAQIYRQSKQIWETSDGGGKARLSDWIRFEDFDVRWIGNRWIGYLGYWNGDWQSNSRPGPFVLAFAPIWLVTLAMLVPLGLAYRHRFKWSLRMGLLATAGCAVLLWLANLRDSA